MVFPIAFVKIRRPNGGVSYTEVNNDERSLMGGTIHVRDGKNGATVEGSGVIGGPVEIPQNGTATIAGADGSVIAVRHKFPGRTR